MNDKKVLAHLQKRMDPKRFPLLPPNMAAIVCCVLGLPDMTDPAFDSFCITADGCLLAQAKGDVGFNHFLGAVRSFEINEDELLKAVKATKPQRELWKSLVWKKMEDHRQRSSYVDRRKSADDVPFLTKEDV